VPIPLFFMAKRWPHSALRNFNLPVFLNGPLFIPPANGMNYASSLLTGFVFQFYIRRHYFAWWSKYNYILAAALDVGSALGVIMIFLCIQLPNVSLNWWGNTVWQNTADFTGNNITFLAVPEQGFFGPSTWA